VELSPIFERPGAFFDVTIGAESEGTTTVRMGAEKLQVIFRSVGGLTKVLAAAERRSCPDYGVSLSGKDLMVSCGGQSLVNVAIPEPTHHRISAATNLTRSEVRALRISGKAGDSMIEEVL